MPLACGLSYDRVMRASLGRSIWLYAGAFRLFLASLLLCGFAVAQSTTEQRAVSEALFQDAKRLLDAGHPEEACPKLAESQRLDPGGGTQLLLGICWERVGRFATAQVELGEALALAKRDGNDAREKIARQHLAAIEPRISRIRLTLASSVQKEELTLTLDGTELPRAVWDTPLPLDRGEHEVGVSAPGFVSTSLRIDLVEEGKTVNVAIPVLVPVDEETEPDVSGRADPGGRGEATPFTPTRPVVVASREPSSRATWGWVLGGVGAASAGVGAAFGITALRLNNEVEAACPQVDCPVPSMERKQQNANRAATVSNVAFSVGLVSLAAGVYLLVTAPPRPPESAFVGRRFADVDVNLAAHGGQLRLRRDF